LLAIRNRFDVVGFDAWRQVATLRSDVRRVADRLLNEGVEHDDLIAVYLANPDDNDAIFAAFEHFLVACEINVPDQDTAIWGLIEFHIDKIAKRDGDLLDLLGRMMKEAYYEFHFEMFPGDSHGIESLVGLFYSYDHMTECHPQDVSWNGKHGDAAIKEIENEFVLAAENWLENYEGLGVRTS